MILEIKVTKKDNKIFLTQSHYIEKVLHRFGFSYCKPNKMPLGTLELEKNEGPYSSH